MKDAAIAAAEELGRLPYKKWAASLVGYPDNGVKEYFKFLPVKHPRSFALILARNNAIAGYPKIVANHTGSG
jgi:hypothetical protein